MSDSFYDRFKKAIKDYMGYILICAFIILGTIAKDASVKYFQNQEWTFSSLNKDATRNSRIVSLISQIREISDADNVTVYLFHNGGFFSSGVPYRKKSPAFESNSALNLYKGYNYNNINLTQVSELIKLLTESPNGFFIKTDSIEEGTWKAILLEGGYISNFYMRLTIGEKMIGYVKLSWKSEIEESKQKSLANQLKNFPLIISSFLTEK